MSKIKILYTIPNFKTAGSGRVVYDLVKGLDKSKFAPEICCSHNEGAFFKEIEKLEVPIHIFPSTANLKPYSSFFFRVFKISRFFRKNKFDIIHSWHWSSDISEPLAARIAGVKWVYTKKAMSWGNPKLWKLRSKLASKILVLNTDMIPRYFPEMESKSELIYLGVNTEQYYPQEKTYTIPTGQNFTKEDFVIVSIANLVPIKGIEYLVEAVNKLNDSSIKLLVVGNNENEYGQKLIQNNDNPNITFINKVIDVRPYHAVADVFVIPTKTSWEGLPVSPLEAMSSQRIVIGSDVEGVREVLASFKEFMCPPKDVDQLCDKILKVKNMSQKEKQGWELSMRKEVEEKFTLDKCLELHQNFYFKIDK